MDTPILYDILSKKLEQKRKDHPSFRLMEIDDRLFPNAQTKHSTLVLEARNSNDELKTVAEIVAESWKKGDKNHLMIEGEGGIGKTVTLLSIPDKFTPFLVPAIYIPLHELTKNDNPIELYIKKWILSDKEDLYEQLLDLIDKSWDKGPQLMLLLDGFNEIAAENRQIISEDIGRWSEYPGIQIVTSSRYDIHTYVALSYDYSTIKLQPLSDKTVEDYLTSVDILVPIDDAVKKLITIPLLLTLYVKTELILRQRETDSSSFREVKNAGSIVWNYLQCELWRFGKEDEDAKNAIIAMEFIAPYMAWQMQRNSLFVLSKMKFHEFMDGAYRLLESHFNKPNDFSFHIKDVLQKADGLPSLQLIRSILEKHLCLFVENGEHYRLMHQQFRDALAAIHLINLSYLSGDSLPQEWNSPIDHYVMQFVVDLISEEEATRLWEQNRKTIPAIEDASRNQLRLQGALHNNDFSHLNFSCLDLNNISLYLYRFTNTIIKLPTLFQRMDKTKLSDKTFSPEGHSGPVNAIVITPDGKHIVTGSTDNTIRIWDLETGDLIGKPIKGHKDSVRAVAVTPDGKRIVSGANDNTIRVWDLETGDLIGKPIKKHKDWIRTIAVTPDGKHIISGSWDQTISVWDLNTGNPIGVPIKGHENGVHAVAMTPNGKRIISGSEDKTIRVWDLETGNQIGKAIKGHKDGVLAIAVTPDGKRIVSGSLDKTIRIWDLETGDPIGKPIKGHENFVNAVVVTPDGKRIVSGSKDGTIRVWDLETGDPIGKPIEGNKDSVRAAAVTPDGKRIISGSADYTIRVWDLETGDPIGKPIEGNKGSVSAIAVTPDGKRIVSGSLDKTIRVWDLETGDPIGKPIEGNKGSVSAVAVTPDGKHIVNGSEDQTIRVWDLETGYPIGKPIEGNKGSVSAVAVTPDGKRIVSGSLDKTVCIWDLETGDPIGKPLKGHENLVNAVVVMPDGRRIVSGSWDAIRVWDMETGRAIGRPIVGHKNWVSAVAVTPDGKRIVSGSWDGTICVWDMETGAAIGRPIEGHKNWVSAVAVTPDGKRIVSKSLDGTIRVWDMETGRAIGRPIEGHKNGVSALAVTPDGKHIVSGSDNSTICIINIETRKVKTIHIHPLSFVGLDFSKAIFSTPELKEILRQNGAKVDPD